MKKGLGKSKDVITRETRGASVQDSTTRKSIKHFLEETARASRMAQVTKSVRNKREGYGGRREQTVFSTELIAALECRTGSFFKQRGRGAPLIKTNHQKEKETSYTHQDGRGLVIKREGINPKEKTAQRNWEWTRHCQVLNRRRLLRDSRLGGPQGQESSCGRKRKARSGGQRYARAQGELRRSNAGGPSKARRRLGLRLHAGQKKEKIWMTTQGRLGDRCGNLVVTHRGIRGSKKCPFKDQDILGTGIRVCLGDRIGKRRHRTAQEAIISRESASVCESVRKKRRLLERALRNYHLFQGEADWSQKES